MRSVRAIMVARRMSAFWEGGRGVLLVSKGKWVGGLSRVVSVESVEGGVDILWGVGKGVDKRRERGSRQVEIRQEQI